MHRTLALSGPRSSCRSNASKIPRNAASVLPLPVGEVRRIDLRSRMDGTQSCCACVKFRYELLNHLASRGCNRACRSSADLEDLRCTRYLWTLSGMASPL